MSYSVAKQGRLVMHTETWARVFLSTDKKKREECRGSQSAQVTKQQQQQQ